MIIKCIEDSIQDEVEVAVFTKEDIVQAHNEFENFKNKQGSIWQKGIYLSKTKIRDFIELYFGEMDDGYLNLPFDGFIGEDELTTEQAVTLFNSLVYVDRVNKSGCNLRKNEQGYIIIDDFSC